ncbi:MAG TPA: T9SS type A sorting domain-containing protein [Ginsengibacter sp.]|nr:T9SS type A sorting domain-containing protein [Ginsengibacter sp.]
MNKIPTFVGKYLIILTTLTFLSSLTNAQITPKLKFRNPVLISGTAGQIGATYKFSNVINNIDAYIKIENIVNGAVLKNIDESSLGYADAWQPTVGGPGTYGSSYIKWDVKFDSAGTPYKFSTLNASAIDVDGDNVRVREFVSVNGQSDYNIPTQIPSLLTLSTTKDTDNIVGTDANDSNLNALGPVINRNGIDTLSQDVRINFNFTNKSEFKIYTGSQVDNNGNTGAIATDRYHCIYFANITGIYGVLPVTYESFNAVFNNNAVNLNWTTSSDINNDHFEIEKSFDQPDFSTTAFVLGSQSENNGIAQYSFIDKDKEISNHTVVYYRLKQVDINEHISYSAIKMVRIINTADQKIAVQVMPNPYLDKINVNFESNNSGKAELRMMSLTGMLIKKSESTINKGINSIKLQDLSSQLPGMYVINIIVNGQSIGSQKIIKN